MGLFNRLDKPVFLKESSDTSEYIQRLTEYQGQASGELKEKIDLEIKLAEIGAFGENNVAFELKNAAMPIYILRDVHYEVDDLKAQIDFIVVTRKVTFLIECKNMIGNIEIDSQGNFLREYSLGSKKIKEGIYSPITQNKRHLDVMCRLRKEQTTNVLKKVIVDKYFYDLHKSIVVLANPKTVLNARYAKKDVKDQVIRADQLIKFMKDANNVSKEMPRSDKEMQAYAEKLLSLHTQSKSDYAMKYEELLSKSGESQVQVAEVKTVSPSVASEETIKKLKAFRLEVSRKENIKPYFVFNDKQLDDLLQKMPQSKKDLLSVSGFASVKVEKYGEAILEILKQNQAK